MAQRKKMAAPQAEMRKGRRQPEKSPRETAAVRAATIHDVARAAGVSNFTVSCALNGKSGVAETTRAAVEAAARQLGYRPNPHAQRLVSGRALNAVGLFSLNLDFGVGTRKMREIQRSLLERGFSAAIHGFGYYAAQNAVDQAALLSDLRRQAPRAIVCETNGLKDEAVEELRLYVAEGGTLVCHCPYLDVDVACDKVILDYAPATRAAALHLLAMRHREPGFFMVSPHKPTGPLVDGFRQGLREGGSDLREDRILWGGDYAAYEEAGESLARQFLALREWPSAVYVVNDYVAQVFIAEIGRAGVRVPDDLSVIGNDDAPIARCGVLPLTTVSHPVAAITASVLQLLYSRLDGDYDGEPRREIVRSELVHRHSVVPPRESAGNVPKPCR